MLPATDAGEWVHDAAYYRCRFPSEYALANKVEHPRNVYLREDTVTPHLERWLAGIFAPSRRASLVERLHASQDTGHDVREEEARRAVADADRKLARHRAVLEALGDDSDPALVAGWIAQVQAERSAAAAQLSERTSKTALTRDDIEALVGSFTDYVALTIESDAGDKAALYAQVGLRLTYYPSANSVTVEATPNPSGNSTCPRGV